MAPRVAPVAESHTIAGAVWSASGTWDQVMNIQLIAGWPLAALRAGPFVAFQDDATDRLPNPLLLCQASSHKPVGGSV